MIRTKIWQRQTKIAWWTPRWSYAPRMWREFQRLFNLKFFGNILLLSGIACTAIVVAFKLFIPQFNIPNLWPMAFSLPGVLLYLAVLLGLHTIIPKRVVVCRESIRIIHGESQIVIKSKDLLSATIVVHDGGKVRLKLRYALTSRDRTRKLGVASSVDLHKLLEVLPVEVTVRDARRRKQRSSN